MKTHLGRPVRLRAATGDLAIHLLRPVSDNLARCFSTLDGTLDAPRMARAARLMMDAEPVLGCRLVRRWWRPCWERLPDLDSVEICTLVEDDDLDAATERINAVALDPYRGPQFRMWIIRGATDTLVVAFNHEVSDGGGMKLFYLRLCEIYKTLRLDPDYRPEPNRGTRSARQVFRRFSFRDKLRILRRFFRDRRARKNPPGDWAFPGKHVRPATPRLLSRRIDTARFFGAWKLAKEIGVSVNDVAVAATYRALHAIIRPAPGTPLRLRMTTDLRRYLPDGDAQAICNLAGGYVVTLIDGIGDTLADTCRRVHDQTAPLKKDFIGTGYWVALPLIRFLPYRWLQRMASRAFTDNPNPEPVPPQLSNGGMILTDVFGYDGLHTTDFRLFGPLIAPPFLQFNLITFRSCFVLNVSFYESGTDPAHVDELFRRFEEELPADTAAVGDI